MTLLFDIRDDLTTNNDHKTKNTSSDRVYKIARFACPLACAPHPSLIHALRACKPTHLLALPINNTCQRAYALYALYPP